MQIAHLRCERDILRQVDHPLIVRLKGSCQDAQCVYFFMEYVPGEEEGRPHCCWGRLAQASTEGDCMLHPV